MGYIAELGAAIVYLSPIQRMSAVGGFTNPYRISDYDAIDPEYGTEADLRALVEAAHNPKLRKYLIGNLLHWVREGGVDGFRCDVAAGIPLGAGAVDLPVSEYPALRVVYWPHGLVKNCCLGLTSCRGGGSRPASGRPST